jgi:glycosyltransferase involved in cell wall biosynthesis
VLLATSHHVPDTFPALAARHDRTVVLVHHLIGRPSERNGGALYNRLSWLGQELSLLFVRRFAARIAFVSNHVRREAAGAAGNQPAYLVPNGVDVPPDLPHVAFAQRRGGIYVGRLHTMKRVADAIEAWSRLPAAPADCQLVIAGGDQDAYARELQTLARDIGIGHRVRFAGHVDDATKWSLLAHAAIFVFPSAEEGWGLVIAEAMAAGLPCVTYDLPVYDDIFTRGRIAVPLGDVDALARACAALLADDARRERLSEEGRALAQTFSWDAAARNLATALTFDD